MGDTRRYAERVSLVDMTPQPDLSSTGFALASDRELLALQPEGGAPFTVSLQPGRYAVEWFDVTNRTTTDGEPIEAPGAAPVPVRAPSTDGPAVVYLVRAD